METTTEKPQSERKIIWRVLGQDEFRSVLADTIENTVVQHLTYFKGGIEFEGTTPKSFDQEEQIRTGARESSEQLQRAIDIIQYILKQEPKKPLPIEEKYKNHPIIALDQIAIK